MVVVLSKRVSKLRKPSEVLVLNHGDVVLVSYQECPRAEKQYYEKLKSSLTNKCLLSQ